jgi:hypothetical protein
VANFGVGITIGSLTVNSPTSATASITVANNTTLGGRTVKMTTGTEVVSLTNGFTVTQGPISLASVSPNTGQQGQTLAAVIINGLNTHFVQGTSVANFGAGITVNTLTVNSAFKATAHITIAANATLGGHTVTMTTGSEVASLASAFTVTPPPPVISSVTPNSGQEGQTLASVAIAGQNTHFVQGTTVANFGAGVKVNSLTVNTATSATANITVANNTTLGVRAVKMTTGTEVASLTNGFTVTQGPISLSSVSPLTGQQGQTLTAVIINGVNTHFVQGTSVANFGAGITVNTLTVNSAFKATANITIAANATLGGHTVTMTTGSEVASLTNAFTVVIPPAVIASVTPNSGQVGHAIASVAIVGQNTHFVQGTTVANFGAGITVNSLTVNSATSATANITVQPTAATGARTVTLTTGTEAAKLASGFTVTP